MTLKEHLIETLFVNAIHGRQLNLPEYWGTAEDIHLGNHIGQASSALVGKDIAKSQDWKRYVLTSTPEQISESKANNAYYTDTLLKHFESYLPEHEKLFICVPESFLMLENWREVLFHGFELCLWTEEQITTDAGWDPDDSSVLEALSVNEPVESFGLFGHTIIRIK